MNFYVIEKYTKLLNTGIIPKLLNITDLNLKCSMTSQLTKIDNFSQYKHHEITKSGNATNILTGIFCKGVFVLFFILFVSELLITLV